MPGEQVPPKAFTAVDTQRCNDHRLLLSDVFRPSIAGLRDLGAHLAYGVATKALLLFVNGRPRIFHASVFQYVCMCLLYSRCTWEMNLLGHVAVLVTEDFRETRWQSQHLRSNDLNRNASNKHLKKAASCIKQSDEFGPTDLVN